MGIQNDLRERKVLHAHLCQRCEQGNGKRQLLWMNLLNSVHLNIEMSVYHSILTVITLTMITWRNTVVPPNYWWWKYHSLHKNELLSAKLWYLQNIRIWNNIALHRGHETEIELRCHLHRHWWCWRLSIWQLMSKPPMKITLAMQGIVHRYSAIPFAHFTSSDHHI